jgi:ACS family pantothenate transporter-like MFS transporter
LYSFVNSQLKDNYGERGLVISSMMTFGFCSQIWVPLFTFPTVQAPRFPHGYPAAVVFEVAMWSILMFGVWYMARWKLRSPDVESIIPTAMDTSQVGSDEKEKENGSDGSSAPQTPVETQAVLALTTSRFSRP